MKKGSAEGRSAFAGSLRDTLRYKFDPFLARPVLSEAKGKRVSGPSRRPGLPLYRAR